MVLVCYLGDCVAQFGLDSAFVWFDLLRGLWLSWYFSLGWGCYNIVFARV